MEKEEVPEIYIPLGTCKKERCRILDPVTHSFSKGDSEVEWCTSEGRYINDDGVECEAYFEMPEQFCFGTNVCYPMGTSKEDKLPENMTGLQICYPITSMKTIESPTKIELAGQYIFDCLNDVTWDKLVEQCDDSIEAEDRKVPAPTFSSYVTATRGTSVKRSDAVKPPYGYPMVDAKQGKKKKVEDRSKPQRAYIKLITKGNGRNLRCITSVYGPGDRKVSPLKYIDVRGKVTPVMKWDGVFWGAHGQKAPYGASVRLRVAEMNYSPQTDGGPRRRMLGPNTSVPEEDDNSDDEGEHVNEPKHEGVEQDEGFENPEENSEDPMKLLGQDSDHEEEHEKEEEEIPPPSPPKKKAISSEKRKELLAKKKKQREKASKN